MKRTKPAAAKPAPGRFEKLFDLCEQELQQSALTTLTTRKPDAINQDETEAFRKAAIQSLLGRPAF